jgi:hypothetical protein
LAAADFFPVFFLIAFFNSPCHEAPKNAITQIKQKKHPKKREEKEKRRFFFLDEPHGLLDFPSCF